MKTSKRFHRYNVRIVYNVYVVYDDLNAYNVRFAYNAYVVYNALNIYNVYNINYLSTLIVASISAAGAASVMMPVLALRTIVYPVS